MKFPEDLKYTDDHEWVRVEGNIATIGVTDHAASELGDVVYIDIEMDGVVSKGDTLGTIEAVKTVADLYSPISGTITEVNTGLNDNPEVVNNDAYGEGWIVKIELSDSSELDELMDADSYKASIGH
ncbi:MAG: glycine cleavage system protein GcvH [Candidatus Kapaibacterium sp.]|nr:glycine cleavage system protein GcvH [Ignavibacteriota bacterium]MCB9220874.1 glycine cleavage system protein GcvH [Ignavibacteria bacterium]